MSLLNKASLIQIPSGYKDGTLYSAKPTNGDGDFTFSRGSNLAATRVNSEGLIEKGRENLTLYSQDFDNASWTKLNATVTANNTTAPDGTNTADLITSTSTNETGVYYFPSVTGINTWSIYAKKGTGRYLLLNTNTPTIATKFDLQDGVIVGTPSTGVIPSIQDVGDGWYRCSITSSTSTNRFTIFITDNTTTNDFGSSIGLTLSIWGAQLEQGLVATDYIETTTTTAQAGILEDMPRLDYSGGATCPSLLLEPSRTNLMVQSEAFFTSAWTDNRINANVTPNATISPEGVQNASEIEFTTTSSEIYDQFTNVASSLHIGSIFVKNNDINSIKFEVVGGAPSIEARATINLQNGTLSNQVGDYTPTIEEYGNGWYRVAIGDTTNSTIATPSFRLKSDGTNTGSFYVYGAMVEAGSYATSYIPTYGASSVTRSADDCTDAGNSSLFNDSEGVLFVEIAKLDISATEGGVRLSKDTNNEIRLNFATSNRLNLFVNVGGSNQVYMDNSSYDLEDYHKIAIKYKLNDYAVYVDGTKIHTDTSATVPTGLDELYFNTFYGKVKSVKVFNTALTDAECIDLTTI